MNWKDILERALWTGVEAPAAVAAVAWFDKTGTIPDKTLIWTGVAGFGLAAFKSIAADRYVVLRAKGRHSA